MISVVIPTYKRVDSLKKTLESLNTQINKEFEVVVVNDDHLNPLHLDLSRYNYQVTVFNNETNKGAGETRNTGVWKSNYEWIAFLDDDDLYRDDKIAVLIDAIRKNPDLDLIYHPVYCEYVNQKVGYLTKPKANITYNDILIGNVIGGTSCFTVKKTFFKKVNGFDASLVAIEDYEFLIRIVKAGAKTMLVNEQLSYYFAFTNSSGLSKDISKAHVALQQIDDKYVNDIEKLSAAQKKERKAVRESLLAFTYLLNLNRKSGVYYFKAFLDNFDYKFLMAAVVGFISPAALIRMRARQTRTI
ncbi:MULTISPECIES: glycosyltransferase family 2 protein [unclassified Chitinophaga]|uniref:glycosyltransferase family 2 protein n=1 Tax=unclassified Chitinophaga TaxID=2619133 RepID=UPI003010077D